MQVKKQQLDLDMEQQSGSKMGKEYTNAEYHHPAYLTYMQSRLPREMSITSDMQMIPHHPYGRKWRRTEKPLDEG